MKKEKIIFIISLVMMLLATSISVYATSCLYNSSDVSYTAPSGSGLSANVQDSLTEVYGHCTDYTSMDTRVDALETQNGNSTLTTTSQTLSGGINELDTIVKTLETKDVDDSTYDSGYITFPNGLTLIYGKKTINTAINSSWGNGYMSGLVNTQITFPIVCSKTYSVIVTVDRNASALAAITANYYYNNTGINGIELYRSSPLLNASNFTLNYQVICEK